jgi:MHS family alpha-ketoglutarate permease-like MFS transporter
MALHFKDIGSEEYFFYYASICAAVSLVSYILMPETRNLSSLDGATPRSLPAARTGR